MRALLAALVIAGGACNTPTPQLQLKFSDSPSGQCPSTDCTKIPLNCKTYMSIRIIDPADPKSPYLSQCVEVFKDAKETMCTLRGVDLEQTAVPVRDLEVQVALFPEHMVGHDPVTGDPLCPANTEYDAANGFPVASDLTPAVGGRAFYHPGDETVSVTLGCTNVEEVGSCDAGEAVAISAQVNDFDSGVTFTGQMTVQVGEPEPSDPFYVLPSIALDALAPAAGQTWAGTVDQPFMNYACLTILDDAPQSTTSVVCRAAHADDAMVMWPNPSDSDPNKRASAGVRLSKAALDQMLAALSLPSFPPAGLTIGIVLNQNGDPVENATVTASNGTIQYFDQLRSTVGGTKTSKSGAWASTDAMFGTTFSAASGVGLPVTRIGGQVFGKVTIVVLQFGTGTGG